MCTPGAEAEITFPTSHTPAQLEDFDFAPLVSLLGGLPLHPSLAAASPDILSFNVQFSGKRPEFCRL